LQGMGTASNHALALDSFADTAAPAAETPDPRQSTALVRANDPSPQHSMPVIAASAKIIEFPRFWTPPPAPLDQ